MDNFYSDMKLVLDEVKQSNSYSDPANSNYQGYLADYYLNFLTMS